MIVAAAFANAAVVHGFRHDEQRTSKGQAGARRAANRPPDANPPTRHERQTTHQTRSQPPNKRESKTITRCGVTHQAQGRANHTPDAKPTTIRKGKQTPHQTRSHPPETRESKKGRLSHDGEGPFGKMRRACRNFPKGLGPMKCPTGSSSCSWARATKRGRLAADSPIWTTLRPRTDPLRP